MSHSHMDNHVPIPTNDTQDWTEFSAGKFPVPRSVENESMVSPELVEYYLRKVGDGRIFNTTTQVCLTLAFCVLIMFGALGNGLVCYVVARNSHMRTPRNIFIINLAISDLTLCLFTQPSNLMILSMHGWKLGNFMCKFVPMFAGTNVFVSTISITAIALDRFQVIVYPTKDSVKKLGAAVALLSIWVISFLMASPLLIFNTIQTNIIFENVVTVHCIENPDLEHEKRAYSIASMIFQYICPIVIVTVAHARICNKLKYRMVNQQPTTAISPFQKRKSAREAKRKRKTNLLLLMIALVFALAWMPLNVVNIMADFNFGLLSVISDQSFSLIFAICHLLVLSSACANPVLYGWLNENFRKEFLSILCCKCCLSLPFLSHCCRSCQEASNSRSRGPASSAPYSKANTAEGCSQYPDVDFDSKAIPLTQASTQATQVRGSDFAE